MTDERNFITLLQRQRVFDKPPHGGAHRRPERIRNLVRDLVQIRLDVLQARVEHVVHLGLRGHLGQVLVSVDDLHDVDDLLAEFLAHFLPADLTLLLVGQVHHVHLDGPHLPGDALVRERPARLLLLVELQRDLAHSVTARVPKRIL